MPPGYDRCCVATAALGAALMQSDSAALCWRGQAGAACRELTTVEGAVHARSHR